MKIIRFGQINTREMYGKKFSVLHKGAMSFELLSDQRKVRKIINSKIHSVYKMQPLCKLEALSHVRGGTFALEMG